MSVERQQFSERLQETLRRNGYEPDSPTQLARHFNAQFAGPAITIHAARKWLVGESIPTQEKLRVLSKWLGVSAEWLRFGTKNKQDGKPSGPPLNPRDRAFLDGMHLLDEKHQKMMHEILRVMIKATKK